MATRTGQIVMASDGGTLVTLWVRRGDETDVVHGDGNLTRRALLDAFDGRPMGKWIDYEVESWGGLAWFRPAEDDGQAAEASEG